MQKWGIATFLLLYSSVTFTVCGESKVPFTTFWIFSLLSQSCKILIQVFTVLKHDIVCTFLIHYGSPQKMLTALFDFVWTTQKRKWTYLYVGWPFCYNYAVSVAIKQLEVSAAHVQVTVSAANMWVTIFIVIMQMRVSVAVMQVVFSAVYYAHHCFHCYYAGDSNVGDSFQ